ncbi:MAG: Phytoene desaturase (neurosporene-forming), partial [uncultured Gemmatimonadaceae bacterium]
ERRRHRLRVRRARRRDPPAGAGAPGHGAREARPARRAGVRLRAGRLHLRRGADDHHRPVAHRRAVRARRPADRRLRAARAGGPVLQHPLRGRLGLPLHGQARRGGERGAPLQPRRRGRLPPLRRRHRGHLQDRLRADRQAVPPVRRHDARGGRPRAAQVAQVGGGVRQRLHQGRAAAAGVLVPPAARGREPVPEHVHLRAHPPPRAEVGGVVRDGRDGGARGRARAAVRRAGRRAAPLDAGARDRRRRAQPADDRRAARRRGAGARGRGGEQRRRGVDVHEARGAALPSVGLGRAPQAAALLDVAVRALLRHRPPVRRRRAPRDPHGPALPRAARRDLHAQDARGRLLALPAPPHRDRPAARPAGVRRLVRALPGAPPRREDGLARGGQAVPRPDRAVPRGALPPRPLEAHRHRALDRPAALRVDAQQPPRQRLLRGAGPHAERVVPPAQPQQGHREPLLRGRGDAPGRGAAGRDELGEDRGRHDRRGERARGHRARGRGARV